MLADTRLDPKSLEQLDKGALRDRLGELQRACVDADLPVIVLFEGWDAAGKGSLIHTVTERLDPRGFDVHPIGPPRPFELAQPWMWRYWLKIPPYGKWAFFDRSWYGRVLVQRFEGIVAKGEWKRAIVDILQFERTLIDDGYVIIKLFLHIENAEQRKRLDALAADPATAWRVSEEDWANHGRYSKWLKLYEKVLKKTNMTTSPWHVLPTASAAHATLRLYDLLTSRIESALEKR